MASISSLGVGSGLPLSELLANLRTAEEAPLRLLKSRYETFQTKLSAYGTLKSAVATFQDAAKGLNKPDTFGAMKGTSSDPSAVNVSIKDNARAVPGTYNIDVIQLATRQSLATVGVESRNDAIGTGGVLEITINGETHQIELTDSSLEGVRNAINEADIGVTASVINNGKATNPFQLAIVANETGTKGAVTGIAVTGNDDLHDLLSFGSGGDAMQELEEAENALIKINGIEIESSSNTVEQAIDGVSLELNGVTSKSVTVTVGKNTAPAVAAIQAFVNAYNALQSTIASLTSYDVENQQGSALTGDSVARTVQSQTRQLLSYRVEGEIGVLSQLGITTDPTTGRLNLDTEKLTRTLSENPGAVDAFFRGENGFAKRVVDVTENMLRSKGLFDNVTEGTKQTLKDLSNQFDRMEQRIEDTMARYQAQFVALDSLLAQMSSTSSYLAQQLDMLTAQAKASMKS